jgi:hypothetical protein
MKYQPPYGTSCNHSIYQNLQEKCGNRFQWDSNNAGIFPTAQGLAGKHIVIKNPAKSGSSFFNYKHTFSVVLLAVVDFNYKFTIIYVGSMGRFSDGSIFSTSALGKKLNKQSLKFPPPALVPNFEQPLPYIFIGDEAFPLSENLMRPYPK